MITSKTNPKIKNVVKLQKSSERREQNRIIIEGRREIERALACGFVIDTLFVCNELGAQSSDIKANVIEEEMPEDEEEPEPEVNEDGTIDANGGDTTSSTPVSEEEMQSDNVDTAPLTGTLLNPENTVIQTDGITTQDGE